jgi:hypothetical protein
VKLTNNFKTRMDSHIVLEERNHTASFRCANHTVHKISMIEFLLYTTLHATNGPYLDHDHASSSVEPLSESPGQVNPP